MATKFSDILGFFDAGIFEDKVSEAMKLAALGAVTHTKKAQVLVQLDIERIGETDSVQVKHMVKFVQPLKRGKRVEDNTSTTPLHIGIDGSVSLNSPSRSDEVPANMKPYMGAR